MRYKPYFARKVSPMKRNADPTTPVLGVPDFVMIVQHNSKTGITQIKSGNNALLNPFNVISICCEIIKGNTQSILQAQSMLIRPGRNNEERSADDPPHNFIPCDDNKEICSFCGSHVGNHKVTSVPVQ